MESAKAFAATVGPLVTVIAVEFGTSIEFAGALGMTTSALATWLIPNMVQVDGKKQNVMDVVKQIT